MGLMMMLANHFITPSFMGAPQAVVDSMLIPVIFPFNLLKAGINSAVTFLVYKAVSRHLIPVSYTHLDVYKRQPSGCAQRPAGDGFL